MLPLIYMIWIKRVPLYFKNLVFDISTTLNLFFLFHENRTKTNGVQWI